MLFNGHALLFTFSGTQVRIAEYERLQSLFKMSVVQQCTTIIGIDQFQIRSNSGIGAEWELKDFESKGIGIERC